MTDRRPIDREAFVTLVSDLSQAELVQFVISLWEAGDWTVERSGAVLTATRETPMVETRRAVVLADSADEHPDIDPSSIDTIVTVDTSIVADRSDGITIVGPGDLYTQALYGIDAPTADALFLTFFDQPARRERASAPLSNPPPPQSQESVDPVAGNADMSRNDTVGSNAAGERSTTGDRSSTMDANEPGRRWRYALLSVLVFLGLVLIALGTGVIPIDGAQGPFDGPMQSVAVPGGDRETSTDVPQTFYASEGSIDLGRQSPTASSFESTSSPTPAPTTTPLTSTLTAEKVHADLDARYANLTPTCDRPPDLVVAIQVGALRTNNASTNDGIYTTWQFASPGNKEITGPYENFVDIVTGDTYAPLLNHHRVTYGSIDITDIVATQQLVVTDRNESHYGYEWILVKQEQGQFEGCWMTDGVRPINASLVLDPE